MADTSRTRAERVGPSAASRSFERWLDAFFADYYVRRPIDATFIGVHHLDHSLPDYSPAARARIVSGMRAALEQLNAIQAEDLTEPQRIDRRLAAGALELEIWEDGARQFYRGNPATYTGDAVFGVISLFLRDAEPLTKRVEAAVSRMRQIAGFLAQGRTTVDQTPREWAARAVRECDSAIRYFETGLPHLVAERGIASTSFLAAASEARDAFTAHRAWLTDVLTARATDEVACGSAAFDRYLRLGHCLPNEQDTDWVEQVGRAAIAEARAALTDLAASIDPARSWQDLLATVPDDHPTTEGYYASYERTWTEARSQALAADLLTWPDYPIEYVPIPRSDREAATGLYYLFYRCPPPFGRPETHRYLVTPVEPVMPADERERCLRANNHAAIKLNHVVHHGGLGHHVQNWHAARAASRIGQVAGVDGPSRIAMFCGGTMVEGWACYATDLMDEIGALSPLERLVQAHGRLRMACRAVADVAIHTGAMSLSEAAGFYEREAGMSPAAALGEAVKNSMFPGAAMMYLIGTDAIHALRRDVAAREGAGFSLRSFHDRFLTFGAIPVTLVREAMLA
jgi:uncharacterized protein (DUF885 family)